MQSIFSTLDTDKMSWLIPSGGTVAPGCSSRKTAGFSAPLRSIFLRLRYQNRSVSSPHSCLHDLKSTFHEQSFSLWFWGIWTWFRGTKIHTFLSTQNETNMSCQTCLSNFGICEFVIEESETSLFLFWDFCELEEERSSRMFLRQHFHEQQSNFGYVCILWIWNFFSLCYSQGNRCVLLIFSWELFTPAANRIQTKYFSSFFFKPNPVWNCSIRLRLPFHCSFPCSIKRAGEGNETSNPVWESNPLFGVHCTAWRWRRLN